MNPPKDISGQRFGRLVAIEPTPERDTTRSVIWKCKCDCGGTAFVASRGLLRGKTNSCGCLRNEKLSNMSKIDLTGSRFGKLVAIQSTEKRKNGSIIWEFQCECGNRIFLPASAFMRRNTTSCGCQRREIAAKRMKDKTAADCVEQTRLTALSETLYKSNTSGVRGVYQSKENGKWIAQIAFQGKTYHLGCFSDLRYAAAARRIAEEELWHPLLEEYIGDFRSEHERVEKLRKYLKEKIAENLSGIANAV